MAIQLEHKEDFNEGLKRLVIEECKTADQAIQSASTTDERHLAVHETRKAFKKIRACLRLVRDHWDDYKEENIFFRDLGRRISEIRDASSHIEILDGLKEQYGSQLYNNSFHQLRNDLLEYRDELARRDFQHQNQLEKISSKLHSKIERIPGWPWDVKNFHDIRPSLKRVYKRGRKGYFTSSETGEVKDYHEWRKRIKYLRYQVDVLNRLWPRFMEALEDEMHEMTDFTGQLHDLHNLKQTVEQRNSPFASAEEKALFFSLMEKQEEYMRKHALLKGRKFYHKSPGRFVNDLEIYWETHHRAQDEHYLPQSKHLEY